MCITVKRNDTVALTCLYIVLLGASGALSTDPDGHFHFAKLRLLTACIAAVCMAVPLAWLAVRHTAARIIISTTLWILLVIELFVFCQFGSRISFQVLDLVRQTNTQETSEFFSTYLFGIGTIRTAAVCIAIVAGYYLLKTGLRRSRVNLRIGKAAVATAMIISAATLSCALFTSWFYYQLALPTVPQYIVAAIGLSDRGHIQQRVEHNLPLSEACMSPCATPPAIVYVIGESWSRLHSSLYGYDKPTNSVLGRELAAGNLLVFDSIVTPSSSTATVMPHLFFTHTAMDSVAWYETPLLPVLMRRAGYRVTLHDNQVTRLLGDDVKGGDLMFFLNTRNIEQAAFDYRNSRLMHYDMDFIDAEADSMLIAPGTMTIVHLNGQHIPAENRYPEAFRQFTADDYTLRAGLDDEQKQQIAHYDNATLYNDSVMGRIISMVRGKDAIVIYHTDHGEEVHDYRNHYGRTLEPVTPDIHNCIYHIPMVVYTTPEYRSNHPRMFDHMQKAVHMPFSITGMPQFIMTAAGIVSPWYRPQADPLSPCYDCASARFGASG